MRRLTQQILGDTGKAFGVGQQHRHRRFCEAAPSSKRLYPRPGVARDSRVRYAVGAAELILYTE